MEKRELVCVACPMGCGITVTLENGEVTSVTGNTCKRGDTYARTECVHPTRMVTSTVKVTGGRLPVVPVKTSVPIAKDKIFACMEEINQVSVEAPVHIGDVIIKGVLGTDVDILATNEDEKI